MKIICAENGLGVAGGEYLTVRPDSAVLRENDDFYMPAFSADVVCGCGVLVRINRLAKCLAAKYAARCYDAIGAGAAFVARDIVRQAVAAGRPCDEAYCFDRSFVVSPVWIEAEAVGETVGLRATIGERQICMDIANLRSLIDEGVSRASYLATLKTGDMVFIGLPASTEVKAGDGIEVRLNDRQLLCFGIK
ncbi:MAG: fumarylacetoacetate hydrolase family protein [Alistipes sp.]